MPHLPEAKCVLVGIRSPEVSGVLAQSRQIDLEMLILAVFTPRLFGENIIVKVVVPQGAIGVVVIV